MYPRRFRRRKVRKGCADEVHVRVTIVTALSTLMHGATRHDEGVRRRDARRATHATTAHRHHLRRHRISWGYGDVALLGLGRGSVARENGLGNGT
jgi:hypothetical protein